jgi:DNA-binding beta-propeller fold protein YncE
MPVLRPSGSDFTSFVKATAQYVAPGSGGKVSKSGGVSVALPGLGAVVRTSLVGITASPRSTTLIIPSIIAVVAAVTTAVVTWVNGGVVTTLAGSGSATFADGTGALASFNQPNGVAYDPTTGNIVVADVETQRIRLVSPTGVVTTLAGSGSPAFADGTGAAASFYNPYGVAIIPSTGDIIVADSGNHRIRVVTYPGGVVTTLAGSGTVGTSSQYADGPGPTASFASPSSVAYDPTTGNIVVADTNTSRIRVVTYPGGVVTTLAGSGIGFADGIGAAAIFQYPRGVAVTPSGVVVVADDVNHRIRLITPTGVVTTLAGQTSSGTTNGTGANARFSGPRGVAVNTSTGAIAVADMLNNRIRLIV